MILAKTPFRVSLVGGGTDIPEFYRRSRYGAVVSLAIDRYMYVMIHPYFHEKLRVKYSRTEDVDSVDQLQHPIVRECLRLMEVTSGVEVASIADIPAGLGLGSSSSFTVCLLHALNAHRGQYVTKEQLAAGACAIEIDKLGEPIGKQDQYAAAYGGLNYIRFLPDESVEVEPLTLNSHVTSELLRRLMLFYVGSPRSARDVLAEQQQTISQGARFEAAERLAALADEMRGAIACGQLARVGEILDQGWQLKKGLASNVTTGEVDGIYDTARKAGASGGKLLGAGSGGFMLFYCEPQFQPAVRKALPLRELPVRCDAEGSKIIYHDFRSQSWS